MCTSSDEYLRRAIMADAIAQKAAERGDVEMWVDASERVDLLLASAIIREKEGK